MAAVALQGDVGVPALLITGPANDLVNQTRLLSSDISRLALSSKAVAGPIKSSPQLPANQTTIRDLGQPGVNATAMKPQVSVGLDQTRIGRPVKGVRLNLKGSYTPLPSSVGGQVVVSVGGQTVDRWPIDSTGDIDRWIDVPDSGLQRYTNLDVAVDISGNTGRCGEFQPVTLTIDGATTVDSSAPGVIRFRRPYWPTLIVPVALYGGVLAFQAYSYASGSTFPFLRFYIAAIPFTACLAMLAVPEREFVEAKRPGRFAPPAPERVPRRRGWPA